MRPSDKKLSEALRSVGLIELAERAAAGEFNEYFGKHALPEIYLVNELGKIGTGEALGMRQRVINGEFDAGSDESEEWANSEEGRQIAGELLREKPAVGRLALRVEGDWWVAYYAMPKTMDKAIELGRIKMGIVESNPERKELFMDLMRSAIAELLEQQGVKVENWNEPTTGPEHERSGRG